MPVRDCTSGFQCMRREVLEAIVERLRYTDYAFLIEVKYRAFRQGFPPVARTAIAVWSLRFSRR
jgi:hypothetical protein